MCFQDRSGLVIDSGKKKKIIKFIGYAISIACVIAIILAFKNLKWGDLKKINNPWSIMGYVAITSIGFAVIVFISSYAWKLTLEFLYGKKIAFGEIRAVYTKSNIAKYIPAGNFAGRNVLGKKLGFSHVDMALSTVIEIITLIFTACLWSVIFAFNSILKSIEVILKHYPAWIFIIFAVAAIALIAAVIILAKRKGILQKYSKLFTLSFLRVFIILFLIYTLTMIIPGTFLVLIFTKGLGVSLSLSKIVIVIAAYMISWVVGYIVPIPGGFGVREAVLLALLRLVCSDAMIAVAILLHRLASILGDIIAFLFELIIEKTTKG